MSPRTPEQFEEIRQQSRARIMETALELFARQGFHNTSISQIAKAANVSKGLMYNYFASKDDLLEAIVRQEIEHGEDLMNILSSTTEDPFEQLRMIVDGSFQMVKTDLKHWKLITMLALQEEIMQRMSELLRQKTERGMEDAILLFERMGVPHPKAEAYLFGATLDGIFLHFLSTGPMGIDYPLDQVQRSLLKRYEPYKTTTNED